MVVNKINYAARMEDIGGASGGDVADCFGIKKSNNIEKEIVGGERNISDRARDARRDKNRDDNRDRSRDAKRDEEKDRRRDLERDRNRDLEMNLAQCGVVSASTLSSTAIGPT